MMVLQLYICRMLMVLPLFFSCWCKDCNPYVDDKASRIDFGNAKFATKDQGNSREAQRQSVMSERRLTVPAGGKQVPDYPGPRKGERQKKGSAQCSSLKTKCDDF